MSQSKSTNILPKSENINHFSSSKTKTTPKKELNFQDLNHTAKSPFQNGFSKYNEDIIDDEPEKNRLITFEDKLIHEISIINDRIEELINNPKPLLKDHSFMSAMDRENLLEHINSSKKKA